MVKFLLIISLFFSTVAVAAYGILLYQQAAVETLLVEEDAPHQKQVLKEAKDLSNEQIGFALHSSGQTQVGTLYKAAFYKTLRFSKGFYDTPYNPPDFG